MAQAPIVVGLPPLAAMFNANGTAYAAEPARGVKSETAAETRFVLWFNGNGIVEKYWIPTETGKDFTITRIPAGPRVVDSLTLAVSEHHIDGFLLVADTLLEAGAAEYRASNVSSFTTVERLERGLQQVAVRTRLEREGVDPAVVGRAQLRVDLTTKKISRGRTTEESAGQSFSLGYFMGIILYIAITLYGVNVMNSVLEEKTTRIVEVLMSSLRPGQHVSLMGADGPGKAEVAVEELARATVFCDDWEQASHGGELAAAVAAGVLGREDVTQLGDVLAGEAQVRTRDDEITLFDSTGLAIQDLAIARAAVAEASGLDLPTIEF